MILIIDNYDSFTYNLVDLVRRRRSEVRVVRNDDHSLGEIVAWEPDSLIISPGPGDPANSGICPEVVRHFLGKRPILGVCLGYQILATALGARLERIPHPVHGRTSSLRHDARGVFRGVDSPTTVMRYHSLRVVPDSLPPELEISAWVDGREEEIMGLRHRELDLEGVQFHPESFLTTHGSRIIDNFLSRG